MNKTKFIRLFSLILISTYLLLLHFTLFTPLAKDFSSFYAALLNLVANKNPYSPLVSSFFPLPQKLSANLNPPIVLFLFSPLVKLSYYKALALWTLVSFILGLIGAGLAFYYALGGQLLKKYYLVLTLFYLALFATMMNIYLVQFGSVLLFLIMLGYHFYLRQRSLAAGLSWGLIISFKFFPALLFFFVLRQGRYKVFFVMLATTLVACLIPYLLYGQEIYLQYKAMMAGVFWYSDNWNASVFGYLDRLLSGLVTTKQLAIIYLFLFFSLLGYYLKKLGPQTAGQINFQPFCLTLTMMLLMPPLGWLYYFPLLVFPLVLTGLNAGYKSMFIWLAAFFFINAPQNYISYTHKLGFLTKFLFASSYFYGLLLLNYLCARENIIYSKTEGDVSESVIRITAGVLILGMVVTAFKLLTMDC